MGLAASGPKSTSPTFLCQGRWIHGPITSFWPLRATSVPPLARMPTKFSIAPFMNTSYQPLKLSAGTWIAL